MDEAAIILLLNLPEYSHDLLKSLQDGVLVQ